MKKIIYVALAALTISGCGGGSTPPAPIFKASITNKPASMSELSNAQISIEVIDNIDAASIEMSSSSDSINIVKIDDLIYQIQAQDVDKITSVRVTMTATDGADTERTASDYFDLVIDNNSFQATLDKIVFTQSKIERLVNADEEVKVLAGLNDALVIVNQTAEMANPPGYNPAQSETALRAALSNIRVSEYLIGNLPEQEINDQLNAFYHALEAHLLPYKDSIAYKLSALSPALNQSMAIGAFIIDIQSETTSFFIGNPALGSFENGEWVFNQNAAFIADLLNSPCAL